MFYKIITFGCQMNISDSERITTVLEKMKYQPTLDENKANLILINCCSVKQKAIDRIFGQEKNFAKLKKKNPSLIIALTGCILKKDKKKFKNKVDLIFDIRELSQLKSILLSFQTKSDSPSNKVKESLNPFGKINSANYFHIKPSYSNKTIAYVPIMTGCNNFCSYCIVPYTRGREISRSSEEILKEIKNLIKKERKEIILLGQNVNSYKSNVKCQMSNVKTTSKKSKFINFPSLLKMINEISGDFKISFMTSHPKDMSNELINTMAKCEKIKKELHLPVQSGDNEILKKMNRKYTVKNYLNLVQKIRKKIPKIFISTDIIVGFPGETKKQFENTVKLCKKIKFNKAFISQYSPRAETVAFKLKNDVSKEEKKKRWKILNEIINKN
ncbi:tRNA (N6-isopentenyl adenosine(37)-C2)-methylthiotransferase MiaB [Candidatus Kuenenbacteria bacterium HGW-Kuenenbacteria-1]|uniref:tRNA-2-methylthio-N(6)-dimethylallyladenosine synthase n=1 Tax=Candidatus Kuenenbacteria bacterium HGW-Kuenenbacteria-1 TaxID=2013812 RepID=A0A2N1UP60_9BACT|nr:MAG: tRNA (N6-isopentenyl adenosine(37)-C2)-methylthiotransferase MiaB [Candidatus Kuenenbacteria bacterium HGW-Kuenenbacteria-1]